MVFKAYFWALFWKSHQIFSFWLQYSIQRTNSILHKFLACFHWPIQYISQLTHFNSTHKCFFGSNQFSTPSGSKLYYYLTFQHYFLHFCFMFIISPIPSFTLLHQNLHLSVLPSPLTSCLLTFSLRIIRYFFDHLGAPMGAPRLVNLFSDVKYSFWLDIL